MGRGPEAEPLGSLSRIALAALALAAGAVAAVLVLDRGPAAPAARPHAVLSVRTGFAPAVAQFGDRLVVRVAVRVDERAVDPSRVRVRVDLAPLTPLGPLRVRRSTGTVVTELQAACISSVCTAASGIRLVRLSPVQVEAPRKGGGSLRAVADWPALEVRGRVRSADVDVTKVPPFRADLSLPPVSYRIAPAALAPLLDVLAALLAVAAVALGAWQAALWARRPRRRDVDELGRALALAREAGSRPAPDRRRALGLLARLLGDRDEPLSGAASELAWSEPHPSPGALSELVDRVAREVER